MLAQQARVVLPQHAATQKAQRVSGVAVDALAADLNQERVRQVTSLDHRIDGAPDDGQVQLEPAAPVDGLEVGKHRSARQPADELE